jgi:hypothetical protein
MIAPTAVGTINSPPKTGTLSMRRLRMSFGAGLIDQIKDLHPASTKEKAASRPC